MAAASGGVPRERVPGAERPGPQSRGAMLLECLVSLAVFVGAGLTILGLVDRSLASMERARDQAVAVDLARSAMSSIECGLASAETLNGPVTPSEDEADETFDERLPSGAGWYLEIETEASQFDGLTLYRVKASKTLPSGVAGGKGREIASYTLHQLVRTAPWPDDESLPSIEDDSKAERSESAADAGSSSRPPRGDAVPANERKPESNQTPARPPATPRGKGPIRPASKQRRSIRAKIARSSARNISAARSKVMKCHQRGFTLPEAMLSIAIALGLSGAMFGFIWNLMERAEKMHALTTRQRESDGLVMHIEEIAQTCIAGDGGSVGFNGSETSLSVLSRGAMFAENMTPEIVSGLIGTRLEFDSGSGEVRGSRWSGGDGPGPHERIVSGVQRVRFRYHDGNEWLTDFDSTARDGLPGAIEISVWYGAADPAAGTTTLEDSRLKAAGLPPDERPALEVERQRNQELSRKPDRRRVILIPDGAPRRTHREEARP